MIFPGVLLAAIANKTVRITEQGTGLVLWERKTVVEWEEPIPGSDTVMKWRMEENADGDRQYEMSADLRLSIMPLQTSNGPPATYEYRAPWPIDPNAPKIIEDDEYQDD